MQNITNVNVELIRQPKGQNWPTVPPPPPPSVSNEHSARSPLVGLRRMDQTLSKTDCIACYVDLIRGLIMYNDLKGTAHSAQKTF